MKKIPVTLLVLLAFLNGFSQKTNSATVYLTNGYSVFGKILKSDSSIIIQTKDKSTYEYALNKVERIEYTKTRDKKASAYLGINGGALISEIIFSKPNNSIIKKGVGPTIGINLILPIKERFYLQTGLNFENKVSELNNYDFRSSYISMANTFSYVLGQTIKFSLNAGFYLGYDTHLDRLSIFNDTIPTFVGIKRLDFGYVLGTSLFWPVSKKINLVTTLFNSRSIIAANSVIKTLIFEDQYTAGKEEFYINSFGLTLGFYYSL